MAYVAKKALITGITGQDGSYLAEFLLAKGYEVHGLIRRASTFNTQRIDHLYKDPHDPEARLFLHYGDLTDGSRLVTLIDSIQPQEIYHLAAQSHVRVSFDEPEYTGDTTGLALSDFLRPFARTIKVSASIKLRVRKCSEQLRLRKVRKLLFIHVPHTVPPKFMPIGQRETTERLTTYLLLMAFYLITKVLAEVKRLSPEKLLERSQR